MRQIYILTFLSIILLSAHATSNTTTVINQALSDINWALILAVLSLISGAILYSLAKALQSRALLISAKNVLYETLHSIYMYGMFVMLLSVLNVLVQSLFSLYLPSSLNFGGDMFDVASKIQLWNLIINGILFLFLIAIVFFEEKIAKFPDLIKIGGRSISFSYESALIPLQVLFGYIIGIILFSFTLHGFTLLLGQFIKVVALRILVPIGFLLRFFYPTRKIGGALIAISLGLYIIFPLVFILDVASLSMLADNNVLTNLDGPLSLVKVFHSSNVYATLLNCDISHLLNTLYHSYDFGSVSGDQTLTFNDVWKGASCFGSLSSDILVNAFNALTTSLKTIFILIGSSFILSKVIRFIETSKRFSSARKLLMGLEFVNGISKMVLAISIAIYMFSFASSITILILANSVIVPFLNLTIIILFIRDVSNKVFDAPLNLSHLLRLI